MADKRLTPDLLIARIAPRQHGVVTASQLLRSGLTRDGVLGRVRAGRLRPVHRGVYAVGHDGLTHPGRWKAATPAAPRGVLSHRSAAELWELLPPSSAKPQPPLPSLAREAGGPDDPPLPQLARARTTGRDNIPVTTPARTLADLMSVASAADVRRATRTAEKRGLPLDPRYLSDRIESDLERDFLAICRRHRVPEPETQAWIGRYHVDFLWPLERLVVEVDGYIYRRGRRAMREDNDRDLDLELAGFRVVRIEDTRIDEDPAGLAAAVLCLLRAAP